jgi:hypothetical protein
MVVTHMFVLQITHHNPTTSGFYTDFQSSSYWQLHTEGLFFKGDWAGSTFYKLNDLVKYGAFQYRCILQHTSSSSFCNRFKLASISEGLQWEDTYNAGTTYQDGDVVNLWWLHICLCKRNTSFRTNTYR